MIGMTVRLIVILFGCVCLISITPLTHAFVALGELNDIVEQFLDIFNELGGQELLERLERGEAVDRQDFEELDAFFGIPCLLGAIRFNKLAKKAASTKCYDDVSVCLTDQEGFGFENCTQNEMIQFTDKLDASGNEFRFANNEASLSPNLQGVFWLNFGLISSSIISFAQTRDGGDLSTGIFERDKEGISYRIRIAGDRNWAFETDSKNEAYGNTRTFDFIYELKVTEGTTEDPERITVFLSFIIPFFPMFRFHLRECFEWLFKFEAILVTDDSAKGEYANSVYWDRRTTSIFLGKNEDSIYPVIQLIDANGTKIEPAYQNWLIDQSKSDTSGNRPNKNFFRALDGDSSTSACSQL